MTIEGWTTLQLVFGRTTTSSTPATRSPPAASSRTPRPAPPAAAFGGYLRAIGRVTEPVSIVVRQGADMGRPSELRIDVSPDDPRVTVSGHAVALP